MANHLSQDILSELKAGLQEKKLDLERELSIINSEDSFKDPDRTVGNAEDADEATEQVSHLENDMKEENVKRTLGLVEKALVKMESGEYGICEVGGEEISLERLQAFPEAATCVDHSDAA